MCSKGGTRVEMLNDFMQDAVLDAMVTAVKEENPGMDAGGVNARALELALDLPFEDALDIFLASCAGE